MHKQIIIVEPNTVQIIINTQTVKNTEKKNVETKVASSVNKNNTNNENTIMTKPQVQTTPQKKSKEVRTDVFTNYPVSSDNIQNINKTTIENTKKYTKPTKTNSPKVQLDKTTSVKQKTQSSQQQKNTQIKTQTKTVSSQEEIIAWNQWNANVHNKLLSDLAKKKNNHEIILASGSSYSYKYTVSKSRIITNISVRASKNDAESAKVVSAMESLIRSYSGSSIMTFPTGSQKDYYNVSSSIVISRQVKQDSIAKASDFSEYEKVKK